MKKFAIFCTEYMETSGGIIVMHYLCHLMRQLGIEAYMFPRFANIPINFALMKNSDYTNKINNTFSVNEEVFRTRSYKTNPVFKTPVMFETPEKGFNDDWVVIYPETTFGNPLGARNVVRWVLAPPFQHQDVYSVGKGDYIVGYGPSCVDVSVLGTFLRQDFLDLRYWRTDIFNTSGAQKRRTGLAYGIRKAVGCVLEHNEPAICIDGLSNLEISRVFKRVRKFISYDRASLYSQYAVLCGAISVVSSRTLSTGGSVDEPSWRKQDFRKGIGYGVDDEAWSISTANELIMYVETDERSSIIKVKKFIEDVLVYFG